MVIKQEVIYRGNKVLLKWIPSKDCKKFKPIKQVYGICFGNDKKILIIKENKEWKLPGGTPEKEETPEETLKREVFEEANVVIGKCFMIGAQQVIFSNNNPNKEQGEHFYQLRYFALIKEIKEQTKNQTTKKTIKRKFIRPSEFFEYIKWGKIGEEILSAAMKEYEN